GGTADGEDPSTARLGEIDSQLHAEIRCVRRVSEGHPILVVDLLAREHRPQGFRRLAYETRPTRSFDGRPGQRYLVEYLREVGFHSSDTSNVVLTVPGGTE